MFINHPPKIHQKYQTWRTWGNDLKPINVLMTTVAITKNGKLATTFHKTSGGENTYVRFGYGPLKIYNHTQGQFSGSMNIYTIDMIHTSQQSTKEVLNKELDGDFRISK